MSKRRVQRRAAKVARKAAPSARVKRRPNPASLPSMMAFRADAWENIITGLGTSRDKREGGQVVTPNSSIDWKTLEDLYFGDDLARITIDTPAQEMVRQWITVNTDADFGKEGQREEEAETPDNPQSQLGKPGLLKPTAIAPSSVPEIKTTPLRAVKADAVLPPAPDQEEQDADDPDTGDEGEEGVEEQDAEEKLQIGKAVLQKLEVLEARTKVYEALVWSKLFGGSILFMGIDDGGGDDPDSMMQPLNEDNMKSIDFLSVFDRWDVSVFKWYDDPTHKSFGLPELYRINQTSSPGGTIAPLSGGIVHESRVIRFGGALVNRRRRLRNAGWDDSELLRVAPVIRDFSLAWGGIAGLLQDFAQAIFKIRGLAEMLSADQDNDVLKRFAIMDMVRSTSRAIPLDAEGEDFERKQTPVSGLAELVDRFALRVSMATRIPVSILMGQGTGGLGSKGSGENDKATFYDFIGAEQERVLRPRLNRLLSIIFRVKDGPTQGRVPANWSMDFNPLWQASDLEKAEIRLQTAQADQVYINSSVLTPEEVAQSRFGGDRYSTETTLDTETRAKRSSDDEQLKAALADAYKKVNPEEQNPLDPAKKPLVVKQEPQDPTKPPNLDEWFAPNDERLDDGGDWDESQHPRDESGRFAGGVAIEKNRSTRSTHAVVRTNKVTGEKTIHSLHYTKEAADKERDRINASPTEKVTGAKEAPASDYDIESNPEGYDFRRAGDTFETHEIEKRGGSPKEKVDYSKASEEYERVRNEGGDHEEAADAARQAHDGPNKGLESHIRKLGQAREKKENDLAASLDDRIEQASEPKDFAALVNPSDDDSPHYAMNGRQLGDLKNAVVDRAVQQARANYTPSGLGSYEDNLMHPGNEAKLRQSVASDLASNVSSQGVWAVDPELRDAYKNIRTEQQSRQSAGKQRTAAKAERAIQRGGPEGDRSWRDFNEFNAAGPNNTLLKARNSGGVGFLATSASSQDRIPIKNTGIEGEVRGREMVVSHGAYDVTREEPGGPLEVTYREAVPGVHYGNFYDYSEKHPEEGVIVRPHSFAGHEAGGTTAIRTSKGESLGKFNSWEEAKQAALEHHNKKVSEGG